MSTDDVPALGDHSLFISADGLRATDAPWRLGEYADELPLSGAQIAELATNHKLDPSVLQELAKRLGYVLNPSHHTVFAPTSRSQSKKRAADDLNNGKAQLRTMTARLEDVIVRLAGLTTDADNDSQLSQDFEQMLEQLERANLAMKEAQTAMDRFAKKPELFLKLEPLGKRTRRDLRRDQVLGAIFQSWVDAGRKIGFTTDPKSSTRGGALVLFAQDVCAKLTDPPTVIGGETIVKLIRQRGKNYRPKAEWLSVFDELRK